MLSKQKEKDKKKSNAAPAVESLVAGRAPRATAGNRLGQLLTEETDDDFYKTALGGFEEESGDDEYETEDDVGDVVDSDFDNDEGEEENAGSDFEEPAKKRVKTTYKDPRVKKTPDPNRKRPAASKKVSEAAYDVTPAQPAVDSAPIKAEKDDASEASGAKRKSSRLATVEQRREHEKRQLESQSRPKKSIKIVQYRKLTQEELLAEAVETEKENLAALAAYRRLEEERKKSKHPKAKISGPTIRFLSSTVPLLSKVEISDGGAPGADPTSSSLTTEGAGRDAMDVANSPCRKYCRNFVSFSSNVETIFDRKTELVPAEQLICPVTSLPAKYRDAVTGTAYATAEAFHIIRTCYARNQHRLQQRLQDKG